MPVKTVESIVVHIDDQKDNHTDARILPMHSEIITPFVNSNFPVSPVVGSESSVVVPTSSDAAFTASSMAISQMIVPLDDNFMAHLEIAHFLQLLDRAVGIFFVFVENVSLTDYDFFLSFS